MPYACGDYILTCGDYILTCGEITYQSFGLSKSLDLHLNHGIAVYGIRNELRYGIITE